jgi:hypothetical protein
MARFLKKLFFFFLFCGCLCYFISYAVDSGLKKTRYGYFAQWNDLYRGKINADLLVLGSSRARQHFNTRVLDSALGLNSYVIGLEAYRLQMQLKVLQIYLRHNVKPKYLVLSLDTYTLHEDHNPYYYQQFLPYLDDSLVRQAFTGYGHNFSRADYLIPGHKYLGQRTWIIIGISEFASFKKYPESGFKGFAGSDQPWDGSFDRFQSAHPSGVDQPLDAQDVKQLDEFLTYCRLQDICVVLVFSPEYKPAQDLCSNRGSVISVYRTMAMNHQVPFMDYSDDPISSRKDLFYNSQHLNSEGAYLFSEKFVSQVRPTRPCEEISASTYTTDTR